MAKNDRKIIKEIEDRFFKKLEEQTSWGKEQLKKMFLQVKSDVLLDELDKEKA
jgi:uncharacterized membrane protein YcaP (DUF421 family)